MTAYGDSDYDDGRDYNNNNNNNKLKFEGCMTVRVPHEIKWNANLIQQGNFIDVFLDRHVSGTCVHHQEH